MTNLEVGQQLVDFCNRGENVKAVDSLYSKDIVSVEAGENPENPRIQKGIETIRGKNQWWIENHEVHDMKVTGPFPNGDDRFAVMMAFDVTFKPKNQRMKLEEVGLYTVSDGKITKEEFFYKMD